MAESSRSQGRGGAEPLPHWGQHSQGSRAAPLLPLCAQEHTACIHLLPGLPSRAGREWLLQHMGYEQQVVTPTDLGALGVLTLAGETAYSKKDFLRENISYQRVWLHEERGRLISSQISLPSLYNHILGCEWNKAAYKMPHYDPIGMAWERMGNSSGSGSPEVDGGSSPGVQLLLAQKWPLISWCALRKDTA